MKVLNCCQHDWANFSHDNANALRSAGIYCVDVKEHSHRFNYDNESKIFSSNKILEQMNLCDVVQIFHSDLKMLNLCKIAEKKRIIVWHTGTYYRKESEKLNKEFNPFVEKSILALGEFYGKGAKNQQYMVGAIDTNKIKPSDLFHLPYKIAHYPSNSTVKGSDTIEEIARKLFNKFSHKFTFKLSTRLVPYHEQLKRISECDIYIELFAPKQDGYNYGSWGITALEAAAMGKIVVTNHTTENVYNKTYGRKTPFIIANTKNELLEKLEKLINKNPEDIRKIQSETRSWVEKYHSYKATGEKLKWIINNA